MGPHLTYRPREGVVFGVLAGKPIRLATLRNQAGMDLEAWRGAARSGPVTTWEKVQELRPGSTAGALGHRLTVATNTALEVYDCPGEYAQRFDGVSPGGAAGGLPNHRHRGSAVFVKQIGGFYLHGPPSCGNPRCIVVLQDWDSLFRALKTTRQVSIVVEL
jgi:hypothetical protein